jgi:ABC-2 type transport system ATP-binding protein
LSGLNLKIEAGQFFGLLGPNGAGKTTLISFICGQTNGIFKKAFILGHQRENISLYKTQLGYAPQEIALFPSLSGRENLDFFSRLLELPKTETDRVLEWVGLTERAQDPVSEYSGGMKRRLNLGVAFLNKPKLLILDEPTVGVDPQSRNFIFERILELKNQGVTMIYCSHYLEEIKKLCDHVGILLGGRLVSQGKTQDLLGNEDLEKRYLDLTGRQVD